MNDRGIVLRETMVSIVVNVAITIAFFFLFFGLGAPIAAVAFGRDFLPQAFMVALMGTLIPGLLVRRGRDTAIATVVMRSVVLAVTALIVAGGGALLFFSRGGVVDPHAGLVIKIVFAAALSAIVTPIAVHRALVASIWRPS